MNIGAWLGGIAVIAGAFGAHSLKNKLDPSELEIFQTATHYLMIHALALVALGIQAGNLPSNSIKKLLLIKKIFLLGIFGFSGSLFAYVFLNLRFLMFITPLGGTLLILAWFMWAYHWKHWTRNGAQH